MQESDEGALQRQPSLFDDLPPAERIAPPSEERLLDDDADAAADRQQMQKAGAGLRRAHAITRDDDDLLPSF
jgi:type IV secretion system protein VirD4